MHELHRINAMVIVLVFGFSTALGGCATIIHGGKQNVSFDSQPPGARVKLSNGMRFTTPQTVSLPRGKDIIVTVGKEGYKSEQVMVTREFNAAATILGNILWLLIGVVVDIVTGAAWTLDPENVTVDLTKEV